MTNWRVDWRCNGFNCYSLPVAPCILLADCCGGTKKYGWERDTLGCVARYDVVRYDVGIIHPIRTP